MQEKKTILEHFNDLKKHIIRILIVSIMCLFACFYFANDIFKFIITIGNLESMKFIFTSPESGFLLIINLAFNVCAIILLPYFLLEMLLFATLKIPKKVFIIFAISVLLYYFAIFLSFKIIIPMFVKVLTSIEFTNVEFYISTQNYITFITKIALAIGFVFEFPVMLFLLVNAKIISNSGLRKKRKIAFVSAFILGAVLTPPDVFSQIIVGLTLYIFYEIVILITHQTAKSLCLQG